ncbi:MAG: response regulator [Zetaproteobacteria bacterium]|nr:response regulator [Zetaproteobacteria bacterium]
MTKKNSSTDILIVEDEAPIARLMEIHLQRAGFSTKTCSNGRKACTLLEENHYQLMLLDRMIPGLRGLDLLRWLRKQETLKILPVIMVTALAQTEERIRGLNEGADDYLPKPFEPDELVARVQALLRRSSHQVIQQQKSTIDVNKDAMEARVNGDRLDLRPLEFKLLRRLMKKPGKVRSRQYLLDHVWGINAFVEERTVDVTIKRLRKTLEKYGLGECIVTVRGSGYRFDEKPHT